MNLSIKFIKIQQQNATDATVDSDVQKQKDLSCYDKKEKFITQISNLD